MDTWETALWIFGDKSNLKYKLKIIHPAKEEPEWPLGNDWNAPSIEAVHLFKLLSYLQIAKKLGRGRPTTLFNIPIVKLVNEIVKKRVKQIKLSSRNYLK